MGLITKKIKDFSFHNYHHHNPISMSSLALSGKGHERLPAHQDSLASRGTPSPCSVFLFLASSGTRWKFVLCRNFVKLWRRITLMRPGREEPSRPRTEVQYGEMRWCLLLWLLLHTLAWISMPAPGRVVECPAQSLVCVSVCAHVCVCTLVCMWLLLWTTVNQMAHWPLSF